MEMEMELELDLALPNPTPPHLIPIQMLDLNSYDFDALRLKLAPTSHINQTNSSSFSFDDQKRINVPKTLHLLLWGTNTNTNTNQPNDEDPHSHHNSSSIFRNDDGEGLVGWPPLKTWRKKLRHGQFPNDRPHNNPSMVVAAAAENGIGGATRTTTRASKLSTYVKVKMEGVAIARKIDLSIHHSFEALTSTLIRMFGISDEKYRNSFKLAYQDREGD